MARMGVGILEDDEESDIAALMLEAWGIDSRDFYYNERILTRENFEKNYKALEKMVKGRQPKEIIFGKAPYFEIGRAPYFVIGYFALLTGAKIPEKMRQDILEAAKWEHEEGYWSDEDFIAARKVYLKDFREKISIHKADLKLHTASFSFSGKDILDSKVTLGVKQFEEMCNSNRLHEIIYLNLDGWDLKTIPEEIFTIPKLESLSVEHNRITELPNEISELKNIKYLSLDYNYITELPESIGELKSLETLGIIHNSISYIPNSVGKLKNLKDIYVKGSQVPRTLKFPKDFKFDELTQTIFKY